MATPLKHEEKSSFSSTTWSVWYAMVIGFLAILIFLFYLFTKHFS